MPPIKREMPRTIITIIIRIIDNQDFQESPYFIVKSEKNPEISEKDPYFTVLRGPETLSL